MPVGLCPKCCNQVWGFHSSQLHQNNIQHPFELLERKKKWQRFRQQIRCSLLFVGTSSQNTISNSELSFIFKYLVQFILSPSSGAYPQSQTQWGTNLVISSRSMSLRRLGTPIIKAVSLSERKKHQTSGAAHGASMPTSLASVLKTATSSGPVRAYCPGVSQQSPRSHYEKISHSEVEGEKDFFLLTIIPYWRGTLLDPIGLLRDSCECNTDVSRAHYWHAGWPERLWVEMRKWERKGRTAEQTFTAVPPYSMSWGVSHGMLIGLWGAEPQQINSLERIMAWADIRHPPPQTHILILLLTRQEEVVKEWGQVSGGQFVIITVDDVRDKNRRKKK